MPKKKTIKKRANKSGTVVKLKGNRRKPYAAIVTTGRNQETGRLVRKALDYFETEIEANDFLDMYNLMQKKNNRLSVTNEQAKMIDNDLFEKVQAVTNKEKSMLTFEEIFNLLVEEKYKYQKNINSIKSWFNNFSSLHKKNINVITLFDLQDVIDNLKKKGRKVGTLAHMKCIAVDIFEYAVIHQYISRDQDFTSYIDVSTNVIKTPNKRSTFSIDEIRQLIKNDSQEARMALIYIFTGARPNELFNINTNNIHIDINSNDDGIEKVVSYMICGSKTDAGRDRIIPIHDLIKPYIIDLLNQHKEYLIIPSKTNNKNYFYNNTYFNKLIKDTHIDHVPYDCRHTFSTLAKLYKIETFARKRIMGHKSNDITDDVYTHSIINYLYEEIQKIKV